MMGEGTVNDEELVEVMTKRRYEAMYGEGAWENPEGHYIDRGHFRADIAYLLAEFRSAGFQVFRPEDCEGITLDDGIGVNRGPWRVNVDWEVGEAWLEADLADGTYFLVPAAIPGGRDER